ncbi:hypothetical protein PTT_15451 [Pyrenophora teres f. teres 0-1]|uniref:Uncharacterized protein n=1 Tax=Pyrenophora teres f. teres (strain 0-1) TaxID=861557 RepID=E3S085_PYRTT|nr:hypothetical protein PTT_15451 [Pyrenophora teres f. teres 0-1]
MLTHGPPDRRPSFLQALHCNYFVIPLCLCSDTSETLSIVKDWKQRNRLDYYFNYACSPNFSPVENC